jgi:hypothetical protein
MIDKSVSRGVAGGVAIGGLAVGAVVSNVAVLPHESRVKFVKGVVFAVVALLAAVSAVVSLGLFSELAKVPVAEKGWAVGVACVFALPAVAVVALVVKKLFSK